MKKWLSGVLVGLMCVGLVACSQPQESAAPPAEEAAATEETATAEEAAEVQSMTGDELTALLGDSEKMNDVLLIDSRDANEFAEGHIEGAQNIFVDEMESRLSEIEAYKDKQVVLYCNTGNKSGKAAEILVKNGFKNVYNAEGVKQYEYALVK